MYIGVLLLLSLQDVEAFLYATSWVLVTKSFPVGSRSLRFATRSANVTLLNCPQHLVLVPHDAVQLDLVPTRRAGADLF